MINNYIHYLNVPGLRNSDEFHWQSIWEREFPSSFSRVNQQNWEQPNMHNWVEGLEEWFLKNSNKHSGIVLIGHSIGCATIIHWTQKYNRQIKGALLVAPSDPEKENYPKYITNFTPIPFNPLPFPSIVIASTNDHVVSTERAQYFADCWGSRYNEIENAGHIDSHANLREFQYGLNLLKEF